MLTVKKLVDEGFMSPSMADIVFTKDERRQRELLSFRNTLQTAYRVCVLYTALLQAYAVGRAIHNDCKVSELAGCKGLFEVAKRIWDPEYTFTSIENYVFSMLSKRTLGDNPDVVTPDAYSRLSRVQKLYEQMQNDNVRFDPTQMSSEDLEDMVSCLPLLKNVSFDDENGKLLFSNQADGASFEIAAFPFISFWDDESLCTSTQITDYFMVLTSVRRDDHNSALLFDVRLLDTRSSQVVIKTLRQQVKRNESLQMICKVIDVSTDWYTVNEGLCDLPFLDNLTNISQSVMQSFWRKHDKTPNKNCIPKLRQTFEGSEIYERIDENRNVPMDALRNVFYELFINCGMFKTMRAMFFSAEKRSCGEDLFNLYLSELDRQGYFLSKSSRSECEQKYESNVEAHLKKLGEIVSNDKSNQYILRSLVIRSEFRAFCVLSAMGLKVENLLTDEENIRSIDDYYDLLRGEHGSHAIKDLREVLLMLTGLYGALIASDAAFDEQRFSELLKAQYRQNSCKELSVLMSDFRTIVEKSRGSRAIYDLLGREIICDSERLTDYMDMLSDALGAPTEEPCNGQKKKIFISYSHKDKDKVSRLKDELAQLLGDGYEVFFDSQLRGGQNWRTIAKREIGSPSCVAVVVFASKNSVVSDAVAFEIEHAKVVAKGKNVMSKDFIVAVNLEDRLLQDYLSEAVHAPENTDEQSQRVHNAVRISSILHSDIIYRSTEELPKLLDDIHEMATSNVDVLESRDYNDVELAIANFYTLLKLGVRCPEEWIKDGEELDRIFKSSPPSGRSCIFPLVVSVKETKIKRDNITLTGYEIVGGKGELSRGTNYILSSRTLGPDDYYCIPNREKTGYGCSWMVEPFLVCHKLFPSAEEKK